MSALSTSGLAYSMPNYEPSDPYYQLSMYVQSFLALLAPIVMTRRPILASWPAVYSFLPWSYNWYFDHSFIPSLTNYDPMPYYLGIFCVTLTLCHGFLLSIVFTSRKKQMCALLGLLGGIPFAILTIVQYQLNDTFEQDNSLEPLMFPIGALCWVFSFALPAWYIERRLKMQPSQDEPAP